MENQYVIDPNTFKCPISHQFFKRPVNFEGHFFERELLKKWLKKHDIHPLTNVYTTNKVFYECVVFKNLLSDFYKKNPKNVTEQYGFKETFDKFKVITLYNQNKIDELITYLKIHDIDLSHIFNDFDHYCLLLTNDIITKHLIDVTEDLEHEYIDGWKPIHYISIFSTFNMFKYIISKGIDLECEDDYGCRPIHLVCESLDIDKIKYIVGKGVNLRDDNDEIPDDIYTLVHKYIIL